jgi:hypothetical protein
MIQTLRSRFPALMNNDESGLRTRLGNRIHTDPKVSGSVDRWLENFAEVGVKTKSGDKLTIHLGSNLLRLTYIYSKS